MNNKFRIKVSEFDPFDYRYIDYTVTAYLDSDGETLWYDDGYGRECIAYLSMHPEAIRV